jgi:hypothetical protein
MSNLNSVFDVISGLPPNGKSALDDNFEQKSGESPVLSEGMIVAVEDQSGTPVVSKMTSANNGATVVPDYPWLVIAGMDQSDAAVANKVTCLALKSGVIFKVATVVSFTIGDLAYANAGVVAKVDASQQAIGQVIEVNSTAGWVVIACGGM